MGDICVGDILVGITSNYGIHNTFYKVTKVTEKTISIVECEKQYSYNGFGGYEWTDGTVRRGQKSFSLRKKPQMKKGYQLLYKTEPFMRHQWLTD